MEIAQNGLEQVRQHFWTGGNMGLPEDLQALQDLHEKGKLTDKEFADAKAATLKLHQEPPPAGRSSRFLLLPRSTVLLAILLLFVGFIWYNAGTKRTTQMIAAAVHAPITLQDDVQDLPASSTMTLPFNLPYSGTLNVNLGVLRGNPIDVFLTTPDQLEAVKKEQWNQVRVYPDFNASKTKTYMRSGQLSQGNYYLVLRDRSLGILSFSASDISVKVQLNP